MTQNEIDFRQEMADYVDAIPIPAPFWPEKFDREVRIDAEVAFRNEINENGRLKGDDDLYDGFILGYTLGREAASAG